MTGRKEITGPLPPGATIGILGGGQLGRMLAMAAARLGLKTHIYSDEAAPCAFQVADARTQGAYDDVRALEKFAAACDVVTFEFENVPDATAEYLAAHVAIAPPPRALSVSQDRVIEKSFIAKLGIAVAPFENVESADDARKAFANIGAKGAILKTRRLGYDGKGQIKVTSADDAARAFETLAAPSILEGFVDFAFEVSAVAARARDGGFALFDIPRNAHENHILKRSTVPAGITQAMTEDAKRIARSIAEALEYVGVLAVEMFATHDHKLIVNEIAPRVHNSGHWTIEACIVSQFEQHIRAVAGWTLGDGSRHSDAVMENIIGPEHDEWAALAAKPAGLHLYGKGEARAGRKMGHITSLSPKS